MIRNDHTNPTAFQPQGHINGETANLGVAYGKISPLLGPNIC